MAPVCVLKSIFLIPAALVESNTLKMYAYIRACLTEIKLSAAHLSRGPHRSLRMASHQ